MYRLVGSSGENVDLFRCCCSSFVGPQNTSKTYGDPVLNLPLKSHGEG